MTGVQYRQLGGHGGNDEELVIIHLHGGGPYGMRLDRRGTSGRVFVAKMHARSKAMAAGVQSGDTLLAVNDYECTHASPDHVIQFISRMSDSNQPITLRLNRSGQGLQQHHREMNQPQLQHQVQNETSRPQHVDQPMHTDAFDGRHLHQPRQHPPFEADRRMTSPTCAISGNHVSKLSTTVEPTRQQSNPDNWTDDTARGGFVSVWNGKEDARSRHIAPVVRQRHVSAVLVPTNEAQPGQRSPSGGVRAIGFPPMSSIGDGSVTIPSRDNDQLKFAPSSSNETERRRSGYVDAYSQAPTKARPSDWSPMIWRPPSLSIGPNPTTRSALPTTEHGLSSTDGDARWFKTASGEVEAFSTRDRDDAAPLTFAQETSAAAADHQFAHCSRDQTQSLHQPPSTSTANRPLRNTATPLPPSHEIPPPWKISSSRDSTMLEEQLAKDDAEVVIWSSKTNDQGRVLEQHNRRPVSVAERPPSSAGRPTWRAADFEETHNTATSESNIGRWSIPEPTPDPKSFDEIRHPTEVGDATRYVGAQQGQHGRSVGAQQGQHGRSVPRELDQRQRYGDSGEFGIRNDNPCEGNRAARNKSPLAVSRRFDSLPLPTVGRRHSALASPPTDLFLTRSGFLAAAGKDDVVEQMKRKKLYGDSSFYQDPEQKYPTIDEQIKLARKVARLLTSSRGMITGRGQEMFIRRQQLSDKWTTESIAGQPFNILTQREQRSRWNTSKTDAPTSGQPQHHDVTTELTELERLRTHTERTRHDVLPPVLCNQIADELRRTAEYGDTTAGRMFARRRTRSDKFVVPEVSAAMIRKPPEPKPPTRPPILETKPQPVLDNAAMRRSVSQSEIGRERRAVSMPRMPKTNVAVPRAAMSPWEAASQFDGRVDSAFEHLADFRRATRQVWEAQYEDDDELEENGRIVPAVVAAVADDEDAAADDEDSYYGNGFVDGVGVSGQMQHHNGQTQGHQYHHRRDGSEFPFIDRQKQTNWSTFPRALPTRAGSVCLFDDSERRSAAMTPNYRQSCMTSSFSSAATPAKDWSRATTPTNHNSPFNYRSARAPEARSDYRPMNTYYRITA